jgi:hypothetical protein
MDSERKGRLVVVILVFLAGIVVIGAMFFQGEQNTRNSERHDMSYTIVLSVNNTIENVTLYLPVPELNGTPVLAGSFVNRSGYGIPADWDLTIVPVDGRPMLSVSAPRIIPEYEGYPIPVEPGKTPDRTPVPRATAFSPETPVLIPFELITGESWTSAIDTSNPAGHEPVFSPPGEYSPVIRNDPVHPGNARSYRIPVSIRYTAESPVMVSIYTRIEGVNAIWKGGWIFNRYSDTVSLVLENGTQGWVEAGGTLVAGEGVFW